MHALRENRTDFIIDPRILGRTDGRTVRCIVGLDPVLRTFHGCGGLVSESLGGTYLKLLIGEVQTLVRFDRYTTLAKN